VLQTKLKGPLTVALTVTGLSIAIGLAGVLLFGYYLDGAAQAMRDKRYAAAQAANLTPRITELRAQETGAAGYERIFSLLLPKQDQLLEVPRVIEQLANSYSVEATFQFLGSPALDVTAATPLPFGLNAKGTPENLAAYLRNLEVTNPRYMIGVERVELSGVVLTPETSQLSVQGSLYYQP
jgi:hypothetical protein